MKGTLLAATALAIMGQAVCAQPTDDVLGRFRSCLQWEGALRQVCLEKLSRELSPASPQVPAATHRGNWVISETTSPVDYSPQITATITSESTAKNAPSSFAIRCRGQRTEVLVSTTGTWRPSSNGELRVAYRINDQPLVEGQWAAFGGGRGAIFKGDVTRFLLPLREGERLSITVYDWQGPHEVTFQIPGLDVVRLKIAAVCAHPAATSGTPRSLIEHRRHVLDTSPVDQNTLPDTHLIAAHQKDVLRA